MLILCSAWYGSINFCPFPSSGATSKFSHSPILGPSSQEPPKTVPRGSKTFHKSPIKTKYASIIFSASHFQLYSCVFVPLGGGGGRGVAKKLVLVRTNSWKVSTNFIANCLNCFWNFGKTEFVNGKKVEIQWCYIFTLSQPAPK